MIRNCSWLNQEGVNIVAWTSVYETCLPSRKAYSHGSAQLHLVFIPTGYQWVKRRRQCILSPYKSHFPGLPFSCMSPPKLRLPSSTRSHPVTPLFKSKIARTWVCLFLSFILTPRIQRAIVELSRWLSHPQSTAAQTYPSSTAFLAKRPICKDSFPVAPLHFDMFHVRSFMFLTSTVTASSCVSPFHYCWSFPEFD